jgi:hypothetical protein
MLFAPLLLFAATAAQTPTAPPQVAPAVPQYSSRRGGRLFISPMGEPFRANGREDDTLADWFTQADRNHDNKLTLDEMQGDADHFFTLLDVNHDGEIDPDEINRYENTVAPEISSGAHFDMASFGTDESQQGQGGERRGGRGGHRRGGEGGGFFRGGDTDQHQGAGRYGLLDLPEPVVSADSDFNRGVSRAEFQAAAGQRFLALDVDHKGYLTLPILETIRPAPPAAPKAPERSKEVDESALPDEGGVPRH